MLNPDTEAEQQLASKGLDTLNAGDLVSLRLPGAGGYGSPAQRELDAIDRDLRDEKISAEKAVEDYGIVIKDAEPAVDREATMKRRGK